MTATETGTTVTTDGIDLVNEDDAGCVFLGLLEHVAYTGGTDTDEHLHKIGTGNGKERDFGLAGNGLGQQCLAGTRRTYHQDTARNLAAQALELARVTEEFNQLTDLFLGLFHTGDISKSSLHLVFAEHARLALAKRHGTATATALHLTHKEDPYTDQQQHREPVNEDGHQQTVLVRLNHLDLDLVAQQVIHHFWVIRRRLGREPRSVTTGTLDGMAFNFYQLNLALLHFIDKIRVIK